MLNIALFGAPGAGKGTQSKELVKKYNLTYISTGDILRKEIAAGTELGLQAKDIINRGGLVSDELIVQIIEKIIESADEGGILFDGFPRTVVQAYILEGLLHRMNRRLLCMLSLEVPREELISRMLKRAAIEGRADDNEEVIKNRFKEYDEKELCITTNMLYSDYCEVLKSIVPKDKEDIVYTKMAQAFLEDEDAPEGSEKLALYYKCIVDDDE